MENRLDEDKLCDYKAIDLTKALYRACCSDGSWKDKGYIPGYISNATDELRAEGVTKKAKADSGKPKLSLVPRQIIYDIAKIREYGNVKYPEGGPDNWKKVEIERYRDAAFRHFLAYLDDPKGAFLCELEKGEKDD